MSSSLLFQQGLEGDDEDSCGINMIGETPESVARGGSAHAHGKRIVPRRTFTLAQFLETESSTIRPYCVISLL